MLPNTILAPEQADILPVDLFYNSAVDMLIDTHTELSALPSDGTGKKLQPLDGMLRDLGVERDNDAGFFILGAFGKVGGDLLAGFAGAAAGGPAAMGLDLASTVLMGASENPASARRLENSTFRRDSGAALRAAPAPQPTMTAATRIMRAAIARARKVAPKHVKSRRAALERRMEDLKNKIRFLGDYKKQGVTHVRMTKDGKELTPLHGQPRLVHKADRDRHQAKADFSSKYNVPVHTLAA